MTAKVIEIIVVLGIFLLSIVNEIGARRSRKRRKSICWIHKRNLTLGLDKADMQDDLFPKKSILKMHNSGTALHDERDTLNFRSIASPDDYLSKLREKNDK